MTTSTSMAEFVGVTLPVDDQVKIIELLIENHLKEPSWSYGEADWQVFIIRRRVQLLPQGVKTSTGNGASSGQFFLLPTRLRVDLVSSV